MKLFKNKISIKKAIELPIKQYVVIFTTIINECKYEVI